MAEFSVQARWVLDAGNVPTPANQTLIQSGDGTDVFYVTFGHLNPPIFDGVAPGAEPTPEMLEGQVYPVVPVARLLLTTDKLVDLHDKIEMILEAVSKAKAEA